MYSQENKHSAGDVFTVTFLLIILVVLGAIIWRKQDVIDWWKLRNYTPEASIQSLVESSSMNDMGRRLFYINKPELLTGNDFSRQCDFGQEKTIVLGCYLGDDRGIFLYKVTDSRLNGVVQTTAAHEMLHAAYNRLSSKNRKNIDNELVAYYKTITDERLLSTINAYKKSEPNELVNEMHSIFGTEVLDLPQSLEEYYRKYFTDRKVVVRLATKYQYEFTSRRDQAAAYDAELATLKTRIESNEQVLNSKERQLEQQYSDLKSLRQATDATTYNQRVDEYNNDVQAYNSLISEVKREIYAYNSIVGKRNALALEERDLTQALTNKSL